MTQQIKKIFTLTLLSFFVYSILAVPYAEAGMWEERREAVAKLNKETLLASLPSVGAQHAAPLLHGISSLDGTRSLPNVASDLMAAALQSLPLAYANFKSAQFPKNWKPEDGLVIQIQDVHMNSEAQANIGKTIQGIAEQGKTDLVALEGAFKDVNVSGFRKYEDQDAVRMAADYFLKEGTLSGAIHAALTAAKALPAVVGVDDKALHTGHINAYKESIPKASELKKNLAQEQAKIEKAKQAAFSQELLEFDRKVEEYRKNDLKIGDYAKLLAQEAKATPQVDTFLKALAMERGLDFGKVEQERSVLIQKLVSQLTKQQISQILNASLAYRLGKVRHTDFYIYLQGLCKKQGVPLKNYPAMDGYIRYVVLSDTIKAEELLEDVHGMEKAGYKKLARTRVERELIERSRAEYLTGKLADFALTPEEWKEYRETRGLGVGVSGLKTRTTSHESRVTRPDLSSFESFFKHAELRDKAMSEKLIKQIAERKAKSAVLVAGGYHSEGMQRILYKEGLAVVTLAPKITKLEGKMGTEYLSVFTQEKTPLEKLFDGDKLFVTPAVFPTAQQGKTAIVITAVNEAIKPGNVPFNQEAAAGRAMVGNEMSIPISAKDIGPNQARGSGGPVNIAVELNPDHSKLVSIGNQVFKPGPLEFLRSRSEGVVETLRKILAGISNRGTQFLNSIKSFTPGPASVAYYRWVEDYRAGRITRGEFLMRVIPWTVIEISVLAILGVLIGESLSDTGYLSVVQKTLSAIGLAMLSHQLHLGAMKKGKISGDTIEKKILRMGIWGLYAFNPLIAAILHIVVDFLLISLEFKNSERRALQILNQVSPLLNSAPSEPSDVNVRDSIQQQLYILTKQANLEDPKDEYSLPAASLKLSKSLNLDLLIADLAEAGQISSENLKKEFLGKKLLSESFMPRLPNSSPNSDSFNWEKWVGDVAVGLKTAPSRVRWILINSIQPKKFIGSLPSDALENLVKSGIFPSVLSRYLISLAREIPSDPARKIPLEIGQIVDPQALKYAQGVLNINLSMPSDEKAQIQVDPLVLTALQYHFRVIRAESARREFNYRGNESKSVMDYYTSKFQPDVANQLTGFLNNHFIGDQLKYVVSSGIGANEEYTRQLAKQHNDSSPKVKWIVINNPGELEEVLPEDADAKNTVFFDISRSGDTQETVKTFEFSSEKFPIRVVAANKGPLKNLAENNSSDNVLILPLPSGIGGRLMRRITPMVYAPMFMAGMDVDAYVKATDKFDRELAFNKEHNLAVNIAEFFLTLFLAGDRSQIAIAANGGTFDSPLFRALQEFLQLWMEGAQKRGAPLAAMQTVLLPHNSHSTLEGILGQLNKYVGFVILGKNSSAKGQKQRLSHKEVINPDHVGLSPQDTLYALAKANASRISQLLPSILIELEQPNLETAAALSTLFEDIAVYYTALTSQDPNSNPEVAAVRTLGAESLKNYAAQVREKVIEEPVTLTAAERKDIKFGTAGWRDSFAPKGKFDTARVKLLIQALARYMEGKKEIYKKSGLVDNEGRPLVVIGYDHRAQGDLSERIFAEVAARVLAANGFHVKFLDRAASTPLNTFSMMHFKAAIMINFTASHNPGIWAGVEFFNGLTLGLANSDVSDPIVADLVEDPATNPQAISTVKIAASLAHSLIEQTQVPVQEYAAYLKTLGIDPEKIRQSRLQAIYDAQNGVGGMMKDVLEALGIPETQIQVINAEADPEFKGRKNSEVTEENLKSLRERIIHDKKDIGIATDGDSDRAGAITENLYFNGNDFAAVLVYGFLKNESQKPDFDPRRYSVVTTVVSASWAAKIAMAFGVPQENIFETAVGFRFINDALRQAKSRELISIVGFEENGGIATAGSIPYKDGFAADLLLLTIAAREKLEEKTVEDLYHAANEKFPRSEFRRADLEYTGPKEVAFGGKKGLVMQELYRLAEEFQTSFKKNTLVLLAEGTPLQVSQVQTLDGVNLVLSDGSRLSIRPSGTEPLFRVYSEASTVEIQEKMIAWAESLIDGIAAKNGYSKHTHEHLPPSLPTGQKGGFGISSYLILAPLSAGILGAMMFWAVPYFQGLTFQSLLLLAQGPLAALLFVVSTVFFIHRPFNFQSAFATVGAPAFLRAGKTLREILNGISFAELIRILSKKRFPGSIGFEGTQTYRKSSIPDKAEAQRVVSVFASEDTQSQWKPMKLYILGELDLNAAAKQLAKNLKLKKAREILVGGRLIAEYRLNDIEVNLLMSYITKEVSAMNIDIKKILSWSQLSKTDRNKTLEEMEPIFIKADKLLERESPHKRLLDSSSKKPKSGGSSIKSIVLLLVVFSAFFLIYPNISFAGVRMAIEVPLSNSWLGSLVPLSLGVVGAVISAAGGYNKDPSQRKLWQDKVTLTNLKGDNTRYKDISIELVSPSGTTRRSSLAMDKEANLPAMLYKIKGPKGQNFGSFTLIQHEGAIEIQDPLVEAAYSNQGILTTAYNWISWEAKKKEQKIWVATRDLQVIEIVHKGLENIESTGSPNFRESSLSYSDTVIKGTPNPGPVFMSFPKTVELVNMYEKSPYWTLTLIRDPDSLKTIKTVVRGENGDQVEIELPLVRYNIKQGPKNLGSVDLLIINEKSIAISDLHVNLENEGIEDTIINWAVTEAQKRDLDVQMSTRRIKLLYHFKEYVKDPRIGTSGNPFKLLGESEIRNVTFNGDSITAEALSDRGQPVELRGVPAPRTVPISLNPEIFRAVDDREFSDKIKGKAVIIRGDINNAYTITLDKDGNYMKGEIVSPSRIKELIPSVAYSLEKKAEKIIFLFHYERPKGTVNPKFTLRPAAEALQKAFPRNKVVFIEREIKEGEIEYIDRATKQIQEDLGQGILYVLDNTRFDSREEGEEDQQVALAKQYMAMGRTRNVPPLFIFEGMPVSHRPQNASVGALAWLISLKDRALGLSFMREFESLYKFDRALQFSREKNESSLLLIGGGPKPDKLSMFEGLGKRFSKTMIGGFMAVTFLKAKLGEKYKAKTDKEAANIEMARKVIDLFENGKEQGYGNLEIAQDFLAIPLEVDKKIPIENAAPVLINFKDFLEGNINLDDFTILDIGEGTLESIKQEAEKAKIVFWNGAMGRMDINPEDKVLGKFSRYGQGGSWDLMQSLSLLAKQKPVGIGGGSLLEAAEGAYVNVEGSGLYVFRGGGSIIQYLSGTPLAIQAFLKGDLDRRPAKSSDNVTLSALGAGAKSPGVAMILVGMYLFFMSIGIGFPGELQILLRILSYVFVFWGAFQAIKGKKAIPTDTEENEIAEALINLYRGQGRESKGEIERMMSKPVSLGLSNGIAGLISQGKTIDTQRVRAIIREKAEKLGLQLKSEQDVNQFIDQALFLGFNTYSLGSVLTDPNLDSTGNTLAFMDPLEKNSEAFVQGAIENFVKIIQQGYKGNFVFMIGEISEENLKHIQALIPLELRGRIAVKTNIELLNKMNEGNFELLNTEVGNLAKQDGSSRPRVFIPRSLALRNLEALRKAQKTLPNLKRAYVSYWEIINEALKATPLRLSETYELAIQEAELVLKFQ